MLVSSPSYASSSSHTSSASPTFSTPLQEKKVTDADVRHAFKSVLNLFNNLPSDHPKRILVDNWITHISNISKLHTQIEKVYHCQSKLPSIIHKRCDFFSADPEVVEEHTKSHSQPNPYTFHKKIYFCDHCPPDQQFQTAKLRDLFQHVSVHLDDDVQLPCPKENCDHLLKSACALRAHIISETSHREQPSLKRSNESNQLPPRKRVKPSLITRPTIHVGPQTHDQQQVMDAFKDIYARYNPFHLIKAIKVNDWINELLKVANTYLKTTGVVFRCNLKDKNIKCNYFSSSPEEFETHHLDKHPSIEQRDYSIIWNQYICEHPQCTSKEVKSIPKKDLLQHAVTHLNIKLPCPECDDISLTPQKLRNHLKDQHPLKAQESVASPSVTQSTENDLTENYLLEPSTKLFPSWSSILRLAPLTTRSHPQITLPPITGPEPLTTRLPSITNFFS